MAHPCFWLAMRVFFRNEAEAAVVLPVIEKAIKQAEQLRLPGMTVPFFARIVLVVWANWREFPEECDCGIGGQILTQRFADRIEVVELQTGDLYVGASNYAVELARAAKADWLTFMSPEACDFLTPKIAAGFVAAIEKCARQAGVALPMLGKSGQLGFTANTLAAWHVRSLVTVGCFPVVAAKVPGGKTRRLLCATETAGLERVELCGVEEVIPQAKLVEQFGRCLAVLVPDSKARYAFRHMDQGRWQRHLRKLRTKQARQEALLYGAGFSPAIIPYGVMKEVF